METTHGGWDNDEKTCFRIELLEGWTWSDFKDVHVTSYEMLGKINQRIDLIVVFKGQVPRGSSMGYLSAGGDQPTNMRHTVMVNATDLTTKLFIKSIVASIVQLHDWTGPHFVDSVEQAREYLAGLEDKSGE